MPFNDELSASELRALSLFYAEAGVEWLLHDEAVDRFAEFENLKTEKQTLPKPQIKTEASAPLLARPSGPPRTEDRSPSFVPDATMVQKARLTAEAALTLEDLRSALIAFDGCNLKRSARSTIFATGNVNSDILIIGPAPSADDDREGYAFAGRAGQLLDKMLNAIGFERSAVLITHIVPWRPPGDRPPSSAETEICRPFIERQIALVKPKAILALGNFSARFFFGDTGTIHSLRGQWKEIAVHGQIFPALATLQPQDLLTAPMNKRLVWQDLLRFRTQFAPENA